MSQPLRIGYIVPQFPGQTHIFFWREIQALEAMGHSVHVFSTRKPPAGLIAHSWSKAAMRSTTYLGTIDPLHAGIALARLTPQGLPGWMLREGVGFTKDALLTLAAAEKLRRHAKRLKLDHIHAHSCGRSALIAAFAHKMGGPRYSMTLHGPLSDYGPGQRFKWANASFATIITQKILDEIHQELAGSLPDRLLIRPMGVDTEVMRRDKPYEAPEKGRPIKVFACGRLNIVKGHQDLMSATRQLIDQGVDVRVEIAGEDDDGGTGYRKELEEHLKKLRLQDHVKLLGAIDAGAVRQKLQEAHIFALASWHEPLGVAYMEAMSMGVPTIGTDAGGVRELIQDGSTGYLVEPRNPGMLARTIRTLANDPDALLRLSAAGRAHIEEHFRASLGAETLVSEIQRLRG
ncbi:exopolysaccharide biosynthesis GT4 family glycosyltransferase EpsE [Tropicibacter naphthalenivorans]|uniref:Spore coat protein SA n=1 Tax=Tropicibacter naphthalenivorans TaxID=441103 RepID=A0A0P1GD37_9RHOB|nr:exopolysaccharide biosynthesis GT4 family glycosyltransferase EpsE [Tropicibacter naphthalenivorans]CUH79431.1 Spore coat protein SA [Tropicibacter naphthalenivorans]SMC72189.1 Glycosyltransferase involved in cell wall bisynthesis [Tropicibacter naphthalenivorans]